MELKKQSALENIDACKELLESMSDALWDHPKRAIMSILLPAYTAACWRNWDSKWNRD